MKFKLLLILAVPAYLQALSTPPQPLISESMNNTEWYHEVGPMKDFVCTSWFHDGICTQGLYLDSGESLESDYSYKVLTQTDEKGKQVEIMEMYFADGVHEGHYGTFQLLECNNDTLIMRNLRNNVDLRYFRKK